MRLHTNNWMQRRNEHSFYTEIVTCTNLVKCQTMKQCGLILTRVFGDTIHIKSLSTTANVVMATSCMIRMSREQNMVRNHHILTTLSS